MTIESIYKKEEIFSNVDKETGTVDMTIPEEVRARMGWKVGDTLHVKASEDGTRPKPAAHLRVHPRQDACRPQSVQNVSCCICS